MQLEVVRYACQDWLITPAAPAVNEAPPADIRGQEFVLVATGVGVITWSPLARGRLTRPYGESTTRTELDPVGQRYYRQAEDADRAISRASAISVSAPDPSSPMLASPSVTAQPYVAWRAPSGPPRSRYLPRESEPGHPGGRGGPARWRPPPARRR